MEIPGSLPPAGPTASNPVALLKTLQTGQTLTATVTRQLANGHVELQIGQTRISSQPPLPLVTGQTIQLRVGETGSGKLDLHILNNLQNIDTLSRALRENLPKQSPVSRALTDVFQKLVNDTPQRQNLPAPVRSAIQQLVSSLPDTRQLSRPDSLQQAIQRSGVRLEAHLARTPAASARQELLQTDLKANISRVIQGLRDYAGLKQGVVTSSNLQTGSQQQLSNNTVQGSPAVQAQLLQTQTSNALPTGKAPEPPARDLVSRLLSLLSTSKPAATDALPATGQAQAGRQSLVNLLSKLPQLFHARQQVHTQQQAQNAPPAQAVRNFVNDLLVQLESGLARIQANQLASLPQDDNAQRPLLVLDVPVNNNGKLDDVHIRIDHEQSGSGDELQHIWRVSLFFNFDELGVIRANIAIHNGQVNTTFHSENPGTSEIFQSHLEELEESLRNAGLDIGFIKSLHVTKIDRDNNVMGQSGIFNEQA